MRRDNREQEAEELNSKVPVRDEQNRKQGSLEAKLGPLISSHFLSRF
jgi:hypothetical protein